MASVSAVVVAVALAAGLLVPAGPVVAQDDRAKAVEGTITLYASVTQDTVDAVRDVVAEQHPDLVVEVFRAPTGELDARIASELRRGDIGADVLWMTDPLSVQRYEADGLLASLDPDAFQDVPEAYRSDTFVGTRLLNLIIVAGDALDFTPAGWNDLADPALAGRVALPDPGFAGSAFAALGYFATADEYGFDFYEALEQNGAVQVSSPVEVLTGVAEGRWDVGITLDKVVRSAVDKGSPIQLVWPEPGAIALYSPAAVVASTDAPEAAAAFLESLVSPEVQAAIAGTGWQPVRPDVEWPHEGASVTPDWADLFGRQAELLEGYRAIFGD
jgi:iron(III) transport system substrate-binding protein